MTSRTRTQRTAAENAEENENAEVNADENAVANVLIEKVLPIAGTEITIIANLLRG